MASTKRERPETTAEPSDGSLLRRFRHGNQDAATELYVRYAQRLRALAQAQCSAELARRVEVDDIVQSVFGSFFRRASQGCYEVPAGEELWGSCSSLPCTRFVIRARSTEPLDVTCDEPPEATPHRRSL